MPISTNITQNKNNVLKIIIKYDALKYLIIQKKLNIICW